MPRCVIFAALPPLQEARDYILPSTLILAADAGWQHAKKMHITPDLVLGDFDSSHVPKGVEVQKLPAEKDDTDTHAAVRLALERGCDDIIILGGMGGRFDHTFANLQSLAFAASNGAGAAMVANGVEARIFAPGTYTVPRREESYLSVFSFGEKADGVCLTGVRYPLKDAVLQASFPLGASNEFVNKEAHLSFTQGMLLVIVQRMDKGSIGVL